MIIRRNYLGKIWHVVDRRPETPGDLDFLCEMFPGAVVRRKTNGLAQFLSNVKFANLHWYE